MTRKQLPRQLAPGSSSAASAPFRPSLRFLYHYVWKHGFRDGYRGWVLCRLLAWYEHMIVLKGARNETAASQPPPLQCPETHDPESHPLDEDHVGPGGAVPHFARFTIFFAIQPLLGTLC